MANTLFLQLEGPLQSWGVRAHWEERDTASEPTKSGVIGLIGCALGLRRDDDQLRVLSDGLRMGVRVDRAGSLLVDYHTTGGAKAADGEPEGMLNAQGKLKRETDVSSRRYLMDASFLVALRGAEADVAACAEALQHPVWPIFLGRKACVPTEPVFAGVGDYQSLEAALKAYPLPER
ncbi:MAG TPA: type I-E CRISPR-associated protein Cas5/CasD, partial [Herpetosiphonaceae bacterium]